MKALLGALTLVCLVCLLLYAANWVLPVPVPVTPKRVIGGWVITVVLMLLVHTCVRAANERRK